MTPTTITITSSTADTAQAYPRGALSHSVSLRISTITPIASASAPYFR